MVTTIQLDEKVKDKLDTLKIHHRETYNEIILRMINSCSSKDKEASRESLLSTIEILSDPETMRNIAEALEEYNQGGGKSLQQVEKELGF